VEGLLLLLLLLLRQGQGGAFRVAGRSEGGGTRHVYVCGAIKVHKRTLLQVSGTEIFNRRHHQR